MLDLDQVIRERHSTRMFLSNRPVPRELVDEALILAQCAPSNSNIQPWHMVFVSRPSRDRRCRPARRSQAPATQYPAPARLVRALPSRTGRSSLRGDGNWHSGQGGTRCCSVAQLGVFPRAAGWHCLHAPRPRPSGRPQRWDVLANVAVSLDRTRPR